MKPISMGLAGGLLAAAALAGVLILGGDDAVGESLQWQDASLVAEGAEIYAAQCAACHGADLEGEPDWQLRRADGLLPAPPHDQTGHTWHHPDRVLIDITTRGTEAVVGGGYQSAMIGFGDILSDREIVAVLSYIKSTWPDDIIAIHDDINRRDAATQP